MKNNRQVVRFVLGSVCLYLLLSVAAILFGFKWKPFRRVNLIADIFTSGPEKTIDSTSDSNAVVINKLPDKDFNLFKIPRLITSFKTDTTKPSMQGFMQKLYELKNGKKRKIRIAYFGDSMIEGDLVTQTIRKLLQQAFGGSGVGFVPITSQVSGYRQTATDKYSGGWSDENFISGKSNHLFFSGHLFRSSGDWVEMADQTITDSAALIEKSLICGKTTSPVTITVNNSPVSINAPDIFNRIVLSADLNKGIKLSVADQSLPLYGISFESASGVYVDNFAFRGVSGMELAGIDSVFLKAIEEKNPYDLIVLQYGTNVLNRPSDRNVSFYRKALMPVVRKLKNCFEKTDFLIVSTADMAFRYDGEYKSSMAIDSLIKTQAAVAYETGCSFYNLFASMGGTNTIVKWVNMKPPLAYKDYIHPNEEGSAILGKYLFDDIINEYDKYLQTRK